MGPQLQLPPAPRPTRPPGWGPLRPPAERPVCKISLLGQAQPGVLGQAGRLAVPEGRACWAQGPLQLQGCWPGQGWSPALPSSSEERQLPSRGGRPEGPWRSARPRPQPWGQRRVLMGVPWLLDQDGAARSNLEAPRGARPMGSCPWVLPGAAQQPSGGREVQACAPTHGAKSPQGRASVGPERSTLGPVPACPGLGASRLGTRRKQCKTALSRDLSTGAPAARRHPAPAAEPGTLALPAPGPHVPTTLHPGLCTPAPTWPHAPHHIQDSRSDGPPCAFPGSGHPPTIPPALNRQPPNPESSGSCLVPAFLPRSSARSKDAQLWWEGADRELRPQPPPGLQPLQMGVKTIEPRVGRDS